MIPDGVGIDHGDRASRADAEAVGFAAMDERFGTAELELGEPLFQKLPGRHALIVRTALGFGRGGAEEDVLFVAVKIEGLGCGLKEVGHFICGPGREEREGCRFIWAQNRLGGRGTTR